MKGYFKKIILGFFILTLIFISCFYFGNPSRLEKINWGVNFSQKQAQNLGLDWQKTYLSLLDDLKVKNIKLISHWDLNEPREGEYHFEDLDWQIKEAEKRNVKIILVIGMKTGRWPECHIPAWLEIQNSKIKNQNLLRYLGKIVNRYKDNEAIWLWQVENEPFFPFGKCPKIEKSFVKKEIELVKSLDAKRPIVFTDSGEFSFWFQSAQLGDIVGITLHRKVWSKEMRTYFKHYWFQPIYYYQKKNLIEKIFKKKVIITELQTEPWCPTSSLNDCSLSEQKKTMSFKQFQENIEFAKKAGFDTIYLWGAEWWYWLKQKHNNSEIWEEAKKLF